MLAELVSIICVIFFVTYGVLCKRFNSKINYWKNKNVAQHKDIKVKFQKVKELGGWLKILLVSNGEAFVDDAKPFLQ